MNKYTINKLNLLLIPLIFCSELIALEILEVKLMDSYKITREFPGKLLPVQQSNLAFEISGKINVINVDIGDVVKEGQILTFPSFWSHKSPPNNSEEAKIIISFNTSIEL